MQAFQADVDGDLDAPEHLRLDVVEGDLEAGDLTHVGQPIRRPGRRNANAVVIHICCEPAAARGGSAARPDRPRPAFRPSPVHKGGKSAAEAQLGEAQAHGCLSFHNDKSRRL